MPNVSLKTPTLDSFAKNFKAISDSDHNVNAFEKNGQTFLVKGRGKFGRAWLACRFKSKGQIRAGVNRSVINVLTTVAKRQIGPEGPMLVAKFLQKQGLTQTSKLTAEQVNAAVKYVKEHADIAKLSDELDAHFRRAGDLKAIQKGVFKSARFHDVWACPTGRKLMEAIGNKTMSYENIYFLKAVDENLAFLDSGADITAKRSAFQRLAKTYGRNAPLEANISSATSKKLMEIAKKPNATIAEMRKALTDARGSMSHIVTGLKQKLTQVIKADKFPPTDNLADLRTRNGYVGGNDTSGLKTKVENAVNKVLRDSGRNREKLLDNVLANPLTRKAYESYVQKGSLQYDSLYPMIESEKFLKLFARGGPMLKEAAQLYLSMFADQSKIDGFGIAFVANIAERSDISKNLRLQFKKDLEANPPDLNKVMKFVELARKESRKMLVADINSRLTGRDRTKFVNTLSSNNPGKWRVDNGLDAYSKKIDELAKKNDVAVKKLAGKLRKNLTRTAGLRKHFDKLTYDDMVKLSKINNALQQRNEAVKILNLKDGVNI